MLISGAPDVPACSRWTKLFGPLCFWTVAVVFGVLPKQLAHISGAYAVEQGDMVTEGDVVGFAEEDTFQRKRHRRFRKVLAW